MKEEVIIFPFEMNEEEEIKDINVDTVGNLSENNSHQVSENEQNGKKRDKQKE